MKSLHRFVGVAVAIPLLLWALTGVVFLVKPGYEGAYERLSPRTYPIVDGVAFPPDRNWSEVRLLQTTLGKHLLVSERGTWRHLDPDTLEERHPPSDAELRSLVSDAIAFNPERYGSVADTEVGVVTTNTGVEITLDWGRLELSQQGSDTRLIDTLYRIHYLQWLGEPGADTLLGIAGLALLLALLATGISMHIDRRKEKGSGAG